MTGEIAAILAMDGIASGAIYVLIGLGLVLIFAVTRVIFVPFGDIAAFTALTLASLETGGRPGTVGLVAVLAVLATAVEATALVRNRAFHRLPRTLLFYLVLPLLPAAAVWFAAGTTFSMPVRIGLALALVLPIAPLLDRIVFRPIADASVLLLLTVAVALHFALSGLGLLFLYFEFTIQGKALRATAINRIGARLVGIRPTSTGTIAYLLASLLAGISGVLIAPVTTIFYDSGFLLGLKAFVGAIIGAMVSYPVTALG